jgi:hypothetical protein
LLCALLDFENALKQARVAINQVADKLSDNKTKEEAHLAEPREFINTYDTVVLLRLVWIGQVEQSKK